MITVNINDDELRAKFGTIENFPVNDMLRAVAITMRPVVHARIHSRGQDASGGQIGTYSPGYLKYRIKHGRGADPKVILSDKRQMEGDFTVIAKDNVNGLGFHNDLNFNKSQWMELTYGKKIYALTEDEKNEAVESAKQFVTDALSR